MYEYSYTMRYADVSDSELKQLLLCEKQFLPTKKELACFLKKAKPMENLSELEAYVVCPPTITRPFFPYRYDKNTLLLPPGNFVGVYYSEELKYAKNLGSNIIALRG